MRGTIFFFIVDKFRIFIKFENAVWALFLMEHINNYRLGNTARLNKNPIKYRSY